MLWGPAPRWTSVSAKNVTTCLEDGQRGESSHASHRCLAMGEVPSECLIPSHRFKQIVNAESLGIWQVGQRVHGRACPSLRSRSLTSAGSICTVAAAAASWAGERRSACSARGPHRTRAVAVSRSVSMSVSMAFLWDAPPPWPPRRALPSRTARRSAPWRCRHLRGTATSAG